MIISRTPYRLSFFGGGTDYPAWYRQHGGAVLAATIDKFCYISARRLPPFFEHRFRVVYSKIECCSTAAEITHPAVRGVLQHLGSSGGMEIHHDGDLPARSGMGSSSAFTVGLLHALSALQGKMLGKRQLALESIRIEQDLLGETVGSQDQVQAAYGGLNYITFHAEPEFSVRPVVLSRERLEEFSAYFMLFYTGIKRTAADVARSYVDNIGQKKRELHVIQSMVKDGLAILAGDQGLVPFGELMHEAWKIKRGLSDLVSNGDIDALYRQARDAGAIGGKLAGAGGGGFMLLFVPPERQAAVRQTLHHLIHVPFRLESSGSQIIFYEPEQDYPAEELRREKQLVRPFHELEY